MFRPLEERMRKHELQSRIRTLRDKNMTLSNVNHELNLEWKDVSVIAVKANFQYAEGTASRVVPDAV